MGRRKKNHPFFEDLEIVDIASNGLAVAKTEDKVIFVRDAIPGDRADIQVYKKRKGILEGRATAIRSYSKERQEPVCQHFGTCGGCKWQNMQYQAQLTFKQATVVNNLKKIGGIIPGTIHPILPSPDNVLYRNKLEYTFSNKRWLTKEEINANADETMDTNGLGFHIPGRFDKVLDIEQCHLQADPSNAIRLSVKEFALKEGLSFFDIRKQHGLLRNLIIRNTTLGEIMVLVSFYENDATAIENTMAHIKSQFPEVTSLLYVVNGKKNDTIFDLDIQTYHGKGHILEKLDCLQYQIGPKTFFQTNSAQATTLYKAALKLADFKGDEMVYDLYSGSGTIACFIAGSVNKVIGLEYIPEAIEDAKANAKMNNIDNASFFAGDIKDLLKEEFVNEQGRPQVIITDPPRAGMHKEVVEQIMKIQPEKIVYISCNAATQARDIALMTTNYHVKAIQPVDMFPHTHHVENIALLVKN